MTITYWQLQALAPLGIIALAPLLLVLVDAVFMGEGKDARERSLGSFKGSSLAAVAGVSLFCALAVAGLNFENANGLTALADSMFVVDKTANFAIALLCSGGLLTLWFSQGFLAAQSIHHGEYYPLLLLSIAGAVALVCAGNLISLFVAIELMTLPVYVLVGFDRRKRSGSEAGMSALLTGVFASAISLYGIALIYGATGHFDYPGIRAAMDGASSMTASGMALAGVTLLLVGVLTRQGFAPFHQWLPDLTAGAPSSVALCIPTTLAVASAFALIRLLDSIAPTALPGFSTLLALLAGITMIVGSLMAVLQSNVKRMLAYGGVAHAGFFLAALIVRTPEARSATLLHITVFLFMQAGALGVISAMARRGKEWGSLSDYNGLAEFRPVLAAVLTLFFLALAGWPGTSGFVSRFVVLSVVIGSDQMLLTLVMMIASVVLFAAYLRVPTAMYMGRSRAGDAEALPLASVLALSVCALVSVYFGLFPGPGPIPFEILEIVQRAVQP